MKDRKSKQNIILARAMYFFLLLILLILLTFHILNIYTINSDKFSVFLITLLFILLIFPSILNIKAFGIIDLKRDPKVLSFNNKNNIKNHGHNQK